jgi:hypothetical protein
MTDLKLGRIDIPNWALSWEDIKSIPPGLTHKPVKLKMSALYWKPSLVIFDD